MRTQTLTAFVFLSLATGAYAADDKPFVWDEASVGDDWQRAVKDFRRDHNFALLIGRTRTHWQGSTDHVKNIEETTDASEITVEYAFHIPWGYGFGYSLGTSASVVLGEDRSSLQLSNHYRASLPGLEGGLVWDATNSLRFNLAAVYGWERTDGIKVQGEPGRLSLTEESVSGKLSVDTFYKLTWAVRLEIEETRFLDHASISHDLEKSVRRYRLGLVKHLL